MKRLLALSLCTLFLWNARAQSVAHTRCERLGKGINLSNWLEGYWQGNWPNPAGYDKNFLFDIKKSGIRSIRLPIYFAGVTDTNPPYAVDTTHVLFQLADSVIAWADELDMMLLIDNHHGWHLSDSSWQAEASRMATLWGVLARRYQHLDPERYIFEMLNEPPLGFSNDSLRIIYENCLDSIRPYAPNHSVVASPNMAGIGLGFFDFAPLGDTNIIYTFHTYDPYPFTHQGFPWSNPYYAPGEVYPYGNFDFMVPMSWDSYEIWKNTHQLPVFLGEFGVGTYADDNSRCHWIDTVGRRIRKNNLSWFIWDVQYDFKIFKGSVIHKDSIIPCFSDALRLYDDSLGTSSVEEMDITDGIRVYPNPARDRFICKTYTEKPGTLHVFDCTGKRIYSETHFMETEIDVQRWPNGIYYLKIDSGHKTLSEKIMINR